MPPHQAPPPQLHQGIALGNTTRTRLVVVSEWQRDVYERHELQLYRGSVYSHDGLKWGNVRSLGLARQQIVVRPQMFCAIPAFMPA